MPARLPARTRTRTHPTTPPRPAPRPARPQPKVAVVQIGANDMTNCAWSATNPVQKQKALDKEIPGIVGR